MFISLKVSAPVRGSREQCRNDEWCLGVTAQYSGRGRERCAAIGDRGARSNPLIEECLAKLARWVCLIPASTVTLINQSRSCLDFTLGLRLESGQETELYPQVLDTFVRVLHSLHSTSKQTFFPVMILGLLTVGAVEGFVIYKLWITTLREPLQRKS